jgi:Zn-dependent M28 family amino/carboxypeptidase
VRNIEVRLDHTDSQTPGAAAIARLGRVVIGAHYDAAPGTPAANDNGSGVAVLLELARAFRERKAGVRFSGVNLVFFVNEEPPYFKTSMMGSWVYAEDLAERREKVAAMYALETLGAYYETPGSQHYPLPGFSLVYPDKGNFLAFIGTTESRDLVQQAVGAFRATRRLPSEGIAAPAAVVGVDWSDHWSFAQHGYPALMVTDTALFRYAYYHTAGDTPEKINYPVLAKAAIGLREMFAGLYLQRNKGA